MKTFLQISKENSFSKQRVYRYYKSHINELDQHTAIIENVTYIDEVGEALIINGLKQIDELQGASQSATENVSDSQRGDSDYFEEMQILSEQLKIKDEQIKDQAAKMDNLQEELHKQNEHSRQQSDKLINLLEQVNELQRNNQVLIARQQPMLNEAEPGKSTEPEKKSGFFKKLFRK